MNEILKERSIISNLEVEYNKYQMEYDYLSSEIHEKENVVFEYDKMINEGQKTFEKVKNYEIIYFYINTFKKKIVGRKLIQINKSSARRRKEVRRKI